MEGKLKVLWSSVTPTIESGYGRVSNQVVKRLIKAGYDVLNHGYQTRGRKHKVDGTFTMLDCGGAEYGANVIPKYLEEYKRDVYITLFDPWIFPDKMPFLGKPWIPYVPIDAEPVSSLVKDKLKYAYRVVCFSEFAAKELEKVGIHSVNIPHGVDTKVYKPLSAKKKDALRKKFGSEEGSFVVGTVGANLWDRKDYPRMIRIFAEFNKKIPNSYLYIHASPDGESGRRFNLNELAKLYGVAGKVKSPRAGASKLTDEQMCDMYNTFDVYLSTSRAEGCGLPILEAQACGIPAIVPDNSAQPEWVKGHGWIVPCSDHIVVLTTPQHNKWYLIDIDEAVDALLLAYGDSDLREKYGRDSRKAMLKYDWDKVVKNNWIPFLNGVYKELYGDERRMYAGGKVFNIRTNCMDAPVVVEVILRKTYSQHLRLDKKDVWLDIGGHIGTFTIDIADQVKHVYTFEPNKENFGLLKRNVKENKVKNATIFNKALIENDDKERKFYLDKTNNTGGHSLLKSEWSKTSYQLVCCENINAIIKKHRINKVKFDCEGSEYELIMAMDLSKIDEMIFEYHFNLLGTEMYIELIDYLAESFTVKKSRLVNPFGQTIVHCEKLKTPDGRKGDTNNK